MRKMTSKLIVKVTSSPKAARLHSNHLCVAKDKQTYCRAIVLKAEPMIAQYKCFLVDIGDVKWFDEDNLFSCPHEFRNIPPMAMRFALYGLIEFSENRHANDIVVKELTNKECWAKIKIKPSEFYKQKGKHLPIPVILYHSLDRSTRVNINALVMEEIVSTFKPPRLSRSTTNYVSITHISQVTGNIFCHAFHGINDLKYVNTLIDALILNGIQRCYDNIRSETALHETLAQNCNKLYLVYSEHKREWYRALILQLETDVSGSKGKNISSHCSVYCFLVDYGVTRVVKLTNVYELSGMLARYPHQSIAMTLDGVQMTRDNIHKLKKLLLPGDNVMVDVVETLNCIDTQKTKTISVVKILKLQKDAKTNKTILSNINQLL